MGALARAARGFESRVKPDLAFGRNGCLEHLPECGKNGVKLSVVALLQFGDLATQILVRGKHRTKLKKGTHDRDIDLDSTIAAQDAGEHGHAVFGEPIGTIAATTTAFSL